MVPERDAVANWMKRQMERLSWTPQRWAKEAGTSPTNITRALDPDQKPIATLSTLHALARAARAPSVLDFLNDNLSRPAPRHVPSPSNDDTVPITSLDLSLSMGPGTLIEEFVEAEPVYFDLALIQSITRTPSDKLRLVKGIGDSMEPTLRTGDRVLVDINERQLTRINGIYWIDHLGSHGIKRLRRTSLGKYMIASDNKDVAEPFEVDAQDVRIEGRVIWFAREL
jgi:phage repressor protein C with HTH and peptisase S24 domain